MDVKIIPQLQQLDVSDLPIVFLFTFNACVVPRQQLLTCTSASVGSNAFFMTACLASFGHCAGLESIRQNVAAQSFPSEVLEDLRFHRSR